MHRQNNLPWSISLQIEAPDGSWRLQVCSKGPGVITAQYLKEHSNHITTDPLNESSGSTRIIRGGGWGTSEELLRSAYRGSYAMPDRSSPLIGFRLVRTAQ